MSGHESRLSLRDMTFPRARVTKIKDYSWTKVLPYSRVVIFAKNQEPYFPSCKFRDFERKLELE